MVHKLQLLYRYCSWFLTPLPPLAQRRPPHTHTYTHSFSSGPTRHCQLSPRNEVKPVLLLGGFWSYLKVETNEPVRTNCPPSVQKEHGVLIFCTNETVKTAKASGILSCLMRPPSKQAFVSEQIHISHLRRVRLHGQTNESSGYYLYLLRSSEKGLIFMCTYKTIFRFAPPPHNTDTYTVLSFLISFF